MMTFKLAPYRLGRSLLDYVVQVYTEERLTLQRRQALAHWKEFLKRNPERYEEAESKSSPRCAKYQSRYLKLQRDRSLKVFRARHSGSGASPPGARSTPIARCATSPRTVRRQQAYATRPRSSLLELRQRQESSSVTAAAGRPARPATPEQTRALARGAPRARWRPGDPGARSFRRRRSRGSPGGRSALHRGAPARARPATTPRCGACWRSSPTRTPRIPTWGGTRPLSSERSADVNTWGAFQAAKRTNLFDQAKFVFLGPFYRGMPDRGLPRSARAGWSGAPSLAESVFATPMRLINAPWMQQLPSEHGAAHLGAAGTCSTSDRGLPRRGHPGLADRLREGARQLDGRPAFWQSRCRTRTSTKLAEMREKAAEQYLNAALGQKRVAMRIGMYQQLGAIYPGSQGRADRRRPGADGDGGDHGPEHPALP